MFSNFSSSGTRRLWKLVEWNNNAEVGYDIVSIMITKYKGSYLYMIKNSNKGNKNNHTNQRE